MASSRPTITYAQTCPLVPDRTGRRAGAPSNSPVRLAEEGARQVGPRLGPHEAGCIQDTAGSSGRHPLRAIQTRKEQEWSRRDSSRQMLVLDTRNTLPSAGKTTSTRPSGSSLPGWRRVRFGSGRVCQPSWSLLCLITTRLPHSSRGTKPCGCTHLARVWVRSRTKGRDDR